MRRSFLAAGLAQLGPSRLVGLQRDDPLNKLGRRPGAPHRLRDRAVNSTSRRKVAVTLPVFKFKDE